MANDTLLPVPYYLVQEPVRVSRPTVTRMARTFREAADSYLASHGEARYMQPVLDYFGDAPLDTIHPFDIRQMAELLYPTQSGSTRNRQAVTPARAVMLHAYDRGWCHLIRVKKFKEEKARTKKPASTLWLHIFCRQCDKDSLDYVAAMVLFMATTGARISEAIRLTWAEVDLVSRSVVLLRTKTSTNSVRSLTDDVAERLRKMQPKASPTDRVFRYTSRFSAAERMKAVCRRADITYKPPHTCGRHTFATMAIELGIDVVTAMKAGGWKSSSVFLETYVHPRINATRLVADRMNMTGMTEL